MYIYIYIHIYIYIYGSVSPGREFWPFHVTKMKNVKPHSSLTNKARPDFSTVLSCYDVVDQYFIKIVLLNHG